MNFDATLMEWKFFLIITFLERTLFHHDVSENKYSGWLFLDEYFLIFCAIVHSLTPHSLKKNMPDNNSIFFRPLQFMIKNSKRGWRHKGPKKNYEIICFSHDWFFKFLIASFLFQSSAHDVTSPAKLWVASLGVSNIFFLHKAYKKIKWLWRMRE